MVALILASVIFQYTTDGIASWNLPGELQFFMVGFLLADLRATRTESQTNRWWDLVSIIVWIAIFAIPSKQITFLLPPLILLAYLATFNGPVSRQIFRTQWIALTGGMCYSFYLMHMLVISSMFKLTGDSSSPPVSSSASLSRPFFWVPASISSARHILF
jgi:peptidoglycan/LPS O-acetylase OafA/YrhL